MAIVVDNEQDRLMFKRIFILYIQMVFVLPTTINKISPVHMASIFKMDTIIERNWRAHVLNFIIKGITDYNLKKKKAIDSCLFALMIIYFHLSKNKDKKMAERPPKLWIANWTKEQLVERIRAEMEDHMISEKNILGDCKDGRHKGKNERNKEKREETKKTKKGRQVQHHHLRLKQLKVTILPLSLRLKTQRIQQENNPPEKPKRHNPKRKKSLLRIHLLSKLNPIMGTVLCKPYYRLSSKLYLLTCSFMHVLSDLKLELKI
ncbi:hypothetical protein Ahy_A09g045852 [Arachis hypogaea]|uniref:Uncharacterized protein n=1 Tax=Arachis hypogaea TaxID=3818 RepID=A0A445BNE6_ARAHY|nr:hypothetical protein Ahy_A09g045852 [Arachis hypogaea]